METKSTDTQIARNKVRKVTWTEINNKLREFHKFIETRFSGAAPVFVYGIPKNGMILAGFLNNWRHIEFINTTNITIADIIFDDIVDSGRTRDKYMNLCKGGAEFYTLYDAGEENCWLEFPWEDTEKDAEDLIVRQLESIGENPSREGLRETPERVVRMWDELYKGYNQEIKCTTFSNERVDQMIILKDIEFYSMCEHHMLPFFGKAHIGYLPRDNTLIGVSKLARIVDKFSRRLQIQERMTSQIAQEIVHILNPLGVGVIVEAKHLCMMIRGVQKQNSTFVSSEMLGIFREKPEVKAEFMAFLR